VGEHLRAWKDRVTRYHLSDHGRDLLSALGGRLNGIGIVVRFIADQAEINERQPSRKRLAADDIIEQR
jgi:hypothetical protein